MNARSIPAATLAVAFLIMMSGKSAVAQYRGQDRRPDTREAPNGAQGRQAIQDDQQRRAFNDHDRQVTRDWYQRNQRHLGVGWRQRDRLSPGMQARLRRGRRLDTQLRRQMHPLPPDLALQYGPAPRGYRYAIIGGNIVLIDDSYQVQDVFTLSLHF